MQPGEVFSTPSPSRPLSPVGAAAPLHWWGTVLYPALLVALFLGLQLLLGWAGVPPAQQAAWAALPALAALLLSLPWRLRRTWGEVHPWKRLGLLPSGEQASGTEAAAKVLLALLRGLLKAVLLLAALTVPLLLLGHARWRGDLSTPDLWNAIALVLGVGFAEELVFRGWLMGELALLAGPRRALSFQACIFALVHPWYRLFDKGDLLHGLVAVLGLIVGLILLGTVLGMQRRADGGLLWGAIGLHGGLVGGWFALQKGLLEISPNAPAWLIGPGAGGSANPIGGVIGLGALLLLLAIRRRQAVRAA